MINLNEIMKNEIKEKQKKFYEENKTEIKNEINGKYNISMKNSHKKYYVNNKEKLNEKMKDYNKKTNFKSQKKYQIENKYKYICFCCDYNTAIITHYKTHCKTLRHK